MTRFAIFEPWGLGDLCIAMDAARMIHAGGHQVVIVCNPSWAAWVSSQPFIYGVIPFFAPWTAKKNKYDPRKYKLKNIFKLGRQLHTTKVDAIIDLREDPRNTIFLSLISRAKIVTLNTNGIVNRYSRPAAICQKLGLPVTSQTQRHQGTPNLIACSFHAAWKNRELPEAKCLELVQGLLKLQYEVMILIPPHATTKLWGELRAAFPHQINLICTDLVAMSEKLRTTQLCISVDSGVMHLAHYYGVPTIALFGFSNFHEWLTPTATLVTSKDIFLQEDMHNFAREHLQPLETLNVDLVIEAVEKIENIK